MADVAYLRSQKRDKQSQLRTYRSRKSKLQDVKNNLDRDFDAYISDAINFNEKVALNLSEGLKGEVLSINNLCYEIDKAKEKYIYQDNKMYDISSDLNSEISRCNSEIERLESEIRRLDRQIEAAMVLKV